MALDLGDKINYNLFVIFSHVSTGDVMNQSIPYVYVVSTSYSGSTLLSMLLNAHPQVTSIGEISNSIGRFFQSGKIKDYYCSCGAEIKQCDFWVKVRQRCSEKGVVLDLHDFDIDLSIYPGTFLNKVIFGVSINFSAIEPLRNRIIWHVPKVKDIVTRILHRNFLIAQSVLEVTGKKIFFDVSKDPRRVEYLSKNNNYDLKVIHLVRDVRGVLNSFRKRGGSKNLNKHTIHWLRVNHSALWLKKRLPKETYLLIKYENLCENTTGVLSEICRFIGVEPLDLISTVNTRPHHIIGNEMRLRPFTGLQLDEEWKTSLTSEQVSKCMEMAGKTSSALGYR